MSDYPSNGKGGVSTTLGRVEIDDQLRLFVAEPAPFPERQYRRLLDGGAPFQDAKGSLSGKRKGPEEEYWFPFQDRKSVV